MVVIYNFHSYNLLAHLNSIILQDSFDFIVESVGVYTNHEIVDKSCEILIKKLDEQETLIEKDELEIKKAENTMENSYDIILENEDYTIGKVLEYFLYSTFYETNVLTYCGFKMLHPHDSYSLIRVAYKEPVILNNIKNDLRGCIEYSIDAFTKIRKEFLKLVSR